MTSLSNIFTRIGLWQSSYKTSIQQSAGDLRNFLLRNIDLWKGNNFFICCSINFLYLLLKVEINNKNVIVVGLDGDYDRHNFGEIHKLIPLCDDIIKLKAYCSICKDGTPGIFTKRINENKEKIFVGSENDYIAVCRKCY